ncbi:MAG: methylated-DNA--[protein]-cysteine S-methyltransferase [Rhizobiaceae bacterium]
MDDHKAVHVFETAFGWAGIAASASGVSRLWLPQPDLGRLRRLAAASGPETRPASPATVELVARIRRYFAGERVSFADVVPDLSNVDPFRLAVYRETFALGYGETLTYGQLANRAGHPGLARETGQALGRNPVPLIVPCHRILAAGNRIGGFSAPGGAVTKARMLALEGSAPARKAEQIALPF